MSTANRRDRADQKSAQELIEEAVHLLRRTPLGLLAIYYAGSGAWVLGLLFFWAHTTWFTPSLSSLAWGSLGLSVLFVVCKTAQAVFCRAILNRQLLRKSPAISLSSLLKIAGAQLRLQTWGLLALPLAAIVSLPFGWTYAYFQNLTVLGAQSDVSGLVEVSWAQAKLWPQQNHLGLLLLSVLAIAVLGNLAGAFFALPWIGRHLLGLDNFLGLDGLALFNSTFFVSLVALAWLAVDPLVKAFYVLRVYYGQAQRTGEDFRTELATINLRSRALVGVLLLLFLFPVTASKLAAVESPPPAPSILDANALDRSIDQVLTQRDFQWRLRPLPTEEDENQDSAIARFFHKGGLIAKDILRSISRGVRDFVRWLDRVFGWNKTEPAASKGMSYRLLSWLLYLSIGIAVLLIGVVIVLMWRKARRAPPVTLSLSSPPSVAPDLRDNNVMASQLPTDGWLGLANQQISAGEWRLALRALYLATLANLGAEGLITLAKFKTDLDYENELDRRALSRRDLLAQFSSRRQTFQRSWYGRVPAAESEVRAWFSEMKP